MLRRLVVLAVLSVLALTGCPPKKNAKEKLRTGRTAYSPTGGKQANGATASYTSPNPQTQWGQIQADQMSVYYLTAFALANANQEDQLGQVSGVYFWGNVAMLANGQIDQQRSRIHLEIFDNKTGGTRSDGSMIEQMFIHIGPEQEGFVGIQRDNQGNIVFSSTYLSLMLAGQNYGGTYQGQVYFYNAYSGEQWNQLGTFSVQSNGFFTGQYYY